MNEQTTWMHQNQVYIVSGGACANSLLFEDKYCHLPAVRNSSILQAGELFFKYLKRFVLPMADILQYKLNATEWVLLVHTRSSNDIRNAYYNQRKQSDKADRTKDFEQIERMLSEHFRMFLSNFARECNMYRQRKGTLVMKRFEKLAIRKEKDYYREFERICDLKLCNYRQIKEKYQPDETEYDVENELIENNLTPHALRSAIGVYKGVLKIEMLPVSVKMVRPNTYILRKILKASNKNINPENPNPKRE